MLSRSEIKISLCSADDIPQAFQATSDGFRHDAPFFDAYFPHHDTATGRASGSRRLLQVKNSNEETHLVKASIVVDEDKAEKIIGLAIWTHMKQVPSDKLEDMEDVEETWPDEKDREYMKRLWKNYVVPRGEAVKQSGGAGVYVLELLAVDHEYQHRGAGASLVSWGTDAADEKGVEAVVEGTPQGVRCYHRCGFRTVIEEMKFDVGDEFANRPRPVLTFLSRSAKT